MPTNRPTSVAASGLHGSELISFDYYFQLVQLLKSEALLSRPGQPQRPFKGFRLPDPRRAPSRIVSMLPVGFKSTFNAAGVI